jgi:asparagine synthase (glutamine-hydrolysing)
VRERHLTYLPVPALNDLWTAVAALEHEGREGVLIEAGCALGGSAIVMATAKSPGRPMYVHDVFGMIPAPGANDGDDVHQRYETIREGRATGLSGDAYYGYEDDLIAKVAGSFSDLGVPLDQSNVHLVKGLFQDTITGDERVALAHIDGDWYESVRTCLERIGPRLVPGGVMVIDDYDAWSGCRTAVDEFLDSHAGLFRREQRTRLHIARI